MEKFIELFNGDLLSLEKIRDVKFVKEINEQTEDVFFTIYLEVNTDGQLIKRTFDIPSKFSNLSEILSSPKKYLVLYIRRYNYLCPKDEVMLENFKERIIKLLEEREDCIRRTYTIIKI